jgi:hypothetical protein
MHAQRLKRSFYRNKVMAVEESLIGQRLSGKRRTWHRNAQLATEEFYHDGLPHGLFRQWSEAGELLGSFRMENGTGTQKFWHDSGRLSQEFTTVGGAFCGRSRIWLRDGTLISDSILLFGRPVSLVEYHRAMLKNPTLPRFRGRLAKVAPRNRLTEKHSQHVLVRGLLVKRNRSEAGVWLKADGDSARYLGKFKKARLALKFIEALYHAGAVSAIVPDIYQSESGDQFGDNLLVKLPQIKKVRVAIRKVCERLSPRLRVIVEPGQDIGEEYLLLSMA